MWRNLFNDNINKDVIIVCKDNKIIKAHSLILKNVSDYFKTLLNSDFKESQTREIVLDDVDYDIMNCFMKDIYSNKVNSSNIKKIIKLIQLSDRLLATCMIEEYCSKLYCSNDFCEYLDTLLEYSKRYTCFTDKCIDILHDMKKSHVDDSNIIKSIETYLKHNIYDIEIFILINRLTRTTDQYKKYIIDDYFGIFNNKDKFYDDVLYKKYLEYDTDCDRELIDEKNKKLETDYIEYIMISFHYHIATKIKKKYNFIVCGRKWLQFAYDNNIDDLFVILAKYIYLDDVFRTSSVYTWYTFDKDDFTNTDLKAKIFDVVSTNTYNNIEEKISKYKYFIDT
jgi:hypothetical protein